MPNEPRTAPEVADRKVLMSSVLMEEWASRDVSGNRLSWNWGEPDADGFYTPTITRHDDDNLAEQARAALLDELRGEVEGLDSWDFGSTGGELYVCLDDVRAALLDDHKGAGK